MSVYLGSLFLADRAIPSGWEDVADPLAEIRKIRHGYDTEGDPALGIPEEARERLLAREEKAHAD